MANGRHIENRFWWYFFVFLVHFGLRRAAAFVSSPTHLFGSAPAHRYRKFQLVIIIAATSVSVQLLQQGFIQA